MAEFRRRRAKLRVKAEEIDYKNVELLKRFVSDKGKINPSRLTGANAKLQRKIYLVTCHLLSLPLANLTVDVAKLIFFVFFK